MENPCSNTKIFKTKKMETSTLAQSAKQNPIQDKKEIPLFIILKDGNGMEHKVCNMDHPDICPRKGTIIVTAIRKSKRHETNFRFSNVRDRNSGIIYGIPQTIDTRTKELIFQRISLGDREEYNLENMQDAQIWAVVRMHQSMEGSPFQYGKAMFKVENREAEAEKTITKARERDRASSIAQQLKGVQLIDMCRNLGIPPEHSSYNLMLAQILESANNDPKRFLEIWDNTNRNIITVLNRAKAVGLLKFDTMKGYLWRDGLPIGSNEMQAVDYLIKNNQLLSTIDRDSKELDNHYKEHGDKPNVMPDKNINLTDSIKNELQAELEEVRKLKEQLTLELQKSKNRDVPKELKK